MLKFSVQTQAFYDDGLKYSYVLPTDLIDIPEEKHSQLVYYINQGKHIDKNLNPSESKPSRYHVWVDGLGWQDNRTDDQKINDELESLTTLSQKQFRLMLIKNGISQDKMTQTIKGLANNSEEYDVIFNYDSEFDVKSDFIGTVFPLLGFTKSAIIDMWKQGMSL